MRYLRQSTSSTDMIGPFLNDVDGSTPVSNLEISAPDVRLSKNGDTWAAKSGAALLSHAENGFYQLTFSTADTDTAGHMRLMVYEFNATPVWHDYTVLPQQVYDSFVAGTDALQVHTNEITADLITAAVIADAAIDADTFAAGAVDANALAADAVDEILDEVVEGTLTMRQMLRIFMSALAGKSAVSGSNRTFRDVADGKNRISATVDSDGQRTAVSTDGT